MDCLRSGRDWVPGVDAALAGRFGGGASVPKKSNPSNDSAGFDCFGGAGSAFGGGPGLDTAAAALLALGGALSSANRSG
jgi:hypothetical protein